ncbi:MAG: M24 family metallopeptidase, partial [Victivallales bacterium]|nr:M24 family metallopeptidase [Victivallales bacterium]
HEDFPISLAHQILNMYNQHENLVGYSLQFQPLKKFAKEREVKTPEEVAHIREGVRKDGTLVWNGELVTSELLKRLVNSEIVGLGGIPSRTIIAPGKQAACPHNRGTGPVHAHEPIVFDIFPRVEATGYFGDLSRTVVKGCATPEVKQAFEAVKTVQAAVREFLKPGVTGKAAQELTEKMFRQLGYKSNRNAKVPYGFIHSVGHGLGLEIHESPSLNVRNSEPLVAGNVVTDEPGLYYPEWGGIRIEDDILITEDGSEDLMTAPIELEIP